MKWGWSVGLACVAAMHTGAVLADSPDILRMNANEYAAVISSSKDPKSGGVTFVLQQAYQIEGRDMGYPKPVGFIKRLFAHLCGSQTATLALINAEDMGRKKLYFDALKNPKMMALNSDPDLLRAAHYVCGDISVQLTKYQGPVKGNPNDDKVLSCAFGAGGPMFFTINEPAKTVDEGPALFGPNTIKFPFNAEDKSLMMTLTIDRFSGGVSIANHTNNTTISGQCEQQANRKF
jgi:hypothetical protein